MSGFQIAQLILAVLVIGTVLLQARNSSLGSTLGGSDSSFFHTRRGIDRILFNLTLVIAFLGHRRLDLWHTYHLPSILTRNNHQIVSFK